MEHAGDADPGSTIEILLQVVDQHRVLGLDAEALARECVDASGGFAGADLRGDHHLIGQIGQGEPLVEVGTQRVADHRDGMARHSQFCHQRRRLVIRSESGVNACEQPFGLDARTVRAQPLRETLLERLGVHPAGLVLGQQLLCLRVAGQQGQRQLRIAADGRAELLECGEDTGGQHTTEVDQDGVASGVHLRRSR